MRLKPKYLLAIATVIGLFLAVAVSVLLLPIFSLSSSFYGDQHRIIHELDYAAIRDAASPLLDNSAEGLVEPNDWPTDIAEAAPNTVFVTNGMVFIEYGSGFGHYGLVVDPDGQYHAARTKLIDDVYFYETEW